MSYSFVLEFARIFKEIPIFLCSTYCHQAYWLDVQGIIHQFEWTSTLGIWICHDLWCTVQVRGVHDTVWKILVWVNKRRVLQTEANRTNSTDTIVFIMRYSAFGRFSINFCWYMCFFVRANKPRNITPSYKAYFKNWNHM